MSSLKQPTPSDYASRDLAMLRQIHRTGVGIPEYLSVSVLKGKAVGHILRRIEGKGLLTPHSRKIPGGRTYWTLTAGGLRAIGASDHKIKTPSSVALDTAIGIGAYCYSDQPRRYPLLPEEIDELYSSAAPKSVSHVITSEFNEGEPVVLRVYHSVGAIKSAKKKVVDFFEASRERPGLAPATASHDYGLLVLSPTEEKRNQLRAAFQKAQLFRLGRLDVGIGPTAGTLAAYLKRRRRRVS